MANGKNNMNDLIQIRELIFGENIKEYDKKFANIDVMLQTIKDTLEKHNEEFRQLRDQLTQTEKELQDKIRASQGQSDKQLETLRREFEAKLQALTAEKTDRLQIGNYLIEMGLRLKGENVLDNLIDTNNSEKNG